MPGATRDRVPDLREAPVPAQAEDRVAVAPVPAVRDRGRIPGQVGVRTIQAPDRAIQVQARAIQAPDRAVREDPVVRDPVQRVRAQTQVTANRIQHPPVPRGRNASTREDGPSASVTAVMKSSTHRAVRSSTGRRSLPMRSASTRAAPARPFQDCQRASRSNKAASVRLRTCSFCRMLVM
jgi:hypothetical protein